MKNIINKVGDSNFIKAFIVFLVALLGTGAIYIIFMVTSATEDVEL